MGNLSTWPTQGPTSLMLSIILVNISLHQLWIIIKWCSESFVKGSIGQGIFLDAKSDIHLISYSDSDWAGCTDTRRSVTCFLVYLGNTLIAWKSNKQATISRSSSEAEYRALAQTVREVQWLTHMLHDLNITMAQSATIYCANTSTIKIEIDCHTIRGKIQQGLVKLLPIRTNHQLADIMTKALPPGLFTQLNSKLGNLNIYCQLARILESVNLF